VRHRTGREQAKVSGDLADPGGFVGVHRERVVHRVPGELERDVGLARDEIHGTRVLERLGDLPAAPLEERVEHLLHGTSCRGRDGKKGEHEDESHENGLSGPAARSFVSGYHSRP